MRIYSFAFVLLCGSVLSAQQVPWLNPFTGNMQLGVRFCSDTVATNCVPRAGSDGSVSNGTTILGTTGPGMSSYSILLPITEGKVTASPPTMASNIGQFIVESNIVVTSVTVQVFGTPPSGFTWNDPTAFGVLVADETETLLMGRVLLGDGATISNQYDAMNYLTPGTNSANAATISKGHRLIVGLQGSGAAPIWPTYVLITIQYRSAEGGDYIVFGDSEASGLYQYALRIAYPKKFGGNFGIPGQWTSQMVAANRTTMALDFKAATVLLLAGANDIINGNGTTDLAAAKANLLTLTNTFVAGGGTVVVGTVPPLTGAQAPKNIQVINFNDYIKTTIAAVPGVKVVDYYAVINPATMKADDIHPNTAGYEAMRTALKVVLGGGW